MKDWTILVYMAGDNNLSEEMITALKGMQSVADEKNVNLLALYESNYPSTPSIIYEFTFKNRDAALEKCVINSNLKTPIDKPHSELDKIPNFIRWVKKQEKYQARNYGLILSGHGDGILGKTMFRSNNSSTPVLTLSKLKDILIRARMELDTERKFSILGFDSCLMNMLEVGYELNEVAEVMVASSGNIPTSGWAYEKVFEDLIKSKGKLNTKDFAVSIVEQFTKFHSEYSVGGRSVNISACDLSKAKTVAFAVGKLAHYLSDVLTADNTELFSGEKVLENTFIIEKIKDLLLNSRYYTQTFLHDQAVDVLDFTQNLFSQCEKMRIEIQFLYENSPKSALAKSLVEKLDMIQSICSEIESAAEEYIIAHSLSGSEYQFSTGTSIFLPWTRLALDLIRKFYQELDFCKTTGKNWLKFIEDYTESTLRTGDQLAVNNNLLRLATSGHKEVGRKAETTKEVGGRQYIGKEQTGRQYIGRDVSFRENAVNDNPEQFYAYFRRVRNYSINPKGYSRTK